MVNLTIFVEGGTVTQDTDSASLTVDNSAVFREGFHRLFNQRFIQREFNLTIESIGSNRNAKKYLETISNENLNAALLIDLDAPSSEKQERIENNYKDLNTTKLFFMIQAMEAWILSQPICFTKFAEEKGLKRKNNDEIGDDNLIRDIHPEELHDPKRILRIILSRYFKNRKGRNKKYSETKDGPVLIGLLNLELLSETFDDVARLLQYIETKEAPLEEE